MSDDKEGTSENKARPGVGPESEHFRQSLRKAYEKACGEWIEKSPLSSTDDIVKTMEEELLKSPSFESSMMAAAVEKAIKASPYRAETIRQAVEDAVDKSPFFKFARWFGLCVAVLAVGAIFGGAIEGTLTVKSVEERAADVKQTIDQAEQGVKENASQASQDIAQKQTDATSKITGVETTIEAKEAELERLIGSAQNQLFRDAQGRVDTAARNVEASATKAMAEISGTTTAVDSSATDAAAQMGKTSDKARSDIATAVSTVQTSGSVAAAQIQGLTANADTKLFGKARSDIATAVSTVQTSGSAAAVQIQGLMANADSQLFGKARSDIATAVSIVQVSGSVATAQIQQTRDETVKSLGLSPKIPSLPEMTAELKDLRHQIDGLSLEANGISLAQLTFLLGPILWIIIIYAALGPALGLVVLLRKPKKKPVADASGNSGH